MKGINNESCVVTIINTVFVDSALGESVALWTILAALRRPQPKVQVCDASR
jgi:hypothetical protein